MKYFDWNDKKNKWLKENRNISFEEIVVEITGNNLLDILNHPNKKKYPNQKMFYVNINDYVFAIPFVEDDEKIFLKTIIPDKKATKKYLGN